MRRKLLLSALVASLLAGNIQTADPGMWLTVPAYAEEVPSSDQAQEAVPANKEINMQEIEAASEEELQEEISRGGNEDTGEKAPDAEGRQEDTPDDNPSVPNEAIGPQDTVKSDAKYKAPISESGHSTSEVKSAQTHIL